MRATITLGAALTLAALLAALVSLLWTPFDPAAQSIPDRFLPPFSGAHWLGTDQYGRDLLSRLLDGARSTVLMALLATFVGTLGGAVIGTGSAYLGGRADEATLPQEVRMAR